MINTIRVAATAITAAAASRVKTYRRYTNTPLLFSRLDVEQINVPIQELRRRLPALQLDPERPVVAICLSAHRSIPAVRLLQAHGFERAVQLQGGMLAWWREEFPAERDSGSA